MGGGGGANIEKYQSIRIIPRGRGEHRARRASMTDDVSLIALRIPTPQIKLKK